MLDRFTSKDIPYESMSVFGKLLHDLGISKYSIAKQLNLTTTSIYYYVNGERPLSLSVARKVQALAKSKGREITLDELYADYPLESLLDLKNKRKLQRVNKQNQDYEE